MALTLLTSEDLPQQVDLGLLKKALALVEAVVGDDQSGKISLAFVDEAESRRINRDYAGNDYATDVLSFDYSEGVIDPVEGGDARGEVVICLPIATAQAEEHITSVQAEIILLFVHGLLHVLGHDHASEDQKAGFSSLQDGIMGRLTKGHRDIFT